MPRMRLLSNSCFVRRRRPERRTLVISRTCACGMTRRRSRPELAGTRPTGQRALAFSPAVSFPPLRNEPANAALRRAHKVKAGPTRLPCYGKRPVTRPRPCLRFNPGARRICNTKGSPGGNPRSGKRHVSTNQPRPIPPCSARVTPPCTTPAKPRGTGPQIAPHTTGGKKIKSPGEKRAGCGPRRCGPTVAGSRLCDRTPAGSHPSRMRTAARPATVLRAPLPYLRAWPA